MITLFDIIVFTIIAISAMCGLYEGIVGLLIRLSGFIVSIIFSFFLYPYIIEFLSGYIQDEVTKFILSSIISYVVSLIICAFITHKFLAILSLIRGGFFDRLLGLVAGVFRGVIICVFFFLITTIFVSDNFLKEETLYNSLQNTSADKYPEWLTISETFPYLEKTSKITIQMLPENTLKSIKLFEKGEPEDAISPQKSSSSSHIISTDLEQELNTLFWEREDTE